MRVYTHIFKYSVASQFRGEIICTLKQTVFSLKSKDEENEGLMSLVWGRILVAGPTLALVHLTRCCHAFYDSQLEIVPEFFDHM